MSKKKKRSSPLVKSPPPQTVEKQPWWCKYNPLMLFSFLVSTLFLLVCTKSSPLYPMNDWVDVHCFFTMGKSILNGIVPYAELYEQKGPVLYFMYAIAALISDRSFIGVFLLEGGVVIDQHQISHGHPAIDRLSVTPHRDAAPILV